MGTLSIVTLEDRLARPLSRVNVLGPLSEELKDLAQRCPAFSATSAWRILRNERMAEIACKGVLSRLAGQVLRLLEGEGVVDRRGGYRLPAAYTHEELGAMVGAGRVAVTRALRELQEEGALELRRRRIHVGDRDALRRVAERGR
jgi:CRP-like cAMP-binding protein